MGEIADDCYNLALEEMEERSVNPDWDGFHSPRFYTRQQALPLTEKPKRDFAFIAIGTTWPFNSRNFLVQALDLTAAVRDFYENEYHRPFRHDKDVPDMGEVRPQVTGGWIVYGQEETVLIHAR